MKTNQTHSNKQFCMITTHVRTYRLSINLLPNGFISFGVFRVRLLSSDFSFIFKGWKIGSLCALLTGFTAGFVVALLLVPLCWWLFSIAIASSLIITQSQLQIRTHHQSNRFRIKFYFLQEVLGNDFIKPKQEAIGSF